MSDEFYDRNDSESDNVQQSDPENGTYHYSYRYDDSASKWEPDSEKYNTPVPERPAPKKKRSLWWIPVAAIMTVVVIGVVIGGVLGVRYLKKEVAHAQLPSIISHQEESAAAYEQESEEETFGLVINDTESSAQAAVSSAGVYLTDVSDVVDKVMPAVVSITSRALVSNGGYGGFFFYYGNQDSGSQREVDAGIGSGTIVGENDKELLILTSYHVVQGSSSLYVTFCDDSAVDGYIKAVSEEDDIAIVAIRLDDISEETMGQIKMATMTNEEPSVGDGAIVIGDALGYGQSVVTGIVSAINREIVVDNKTITVIQTDAAINQGNSGGCLLNQKGEIIGISEAKINSSVVEGMCYAISMNYYYDKIMEMLERAPAEDNGKDDEAPIPSSQGAYLGIYGYDIGSQLADSYGVPEGVYVLNTVKGGGAEEAGIKDGDVIIGLDGRNITSMTDLQEALADYSPGDEVTVTLMRENNNGYEKIEVEVTLTAAIG
ncbi:MAG: PDZ domain-containing protein [Lachnospiraceae bacterium]|nr:PDZ domain-containing protein [Lachnospiraceae bacterium]